MKYSINAIWPRQWFIPTVALSLSLALAGSVNAQPNEGQTSSSGLDSIPAPTLVCTQVNSQDAPLSTPAYEFNSTAAQFPEPAVYQATDSLQPAAFANIPVLAVGASPDPSVDSTKASASQAAATSDATYNVGAGSDSNASPASPPRSSDTIKTTAPEDPALKAPIVYGTEKSRYVPSGAPNPSKAVQVPAEVPVGSMLPSEVADIEGAPTYNMREAMRMAMHNSPSLNSARAAYEQAKGATEEAYTGQHPTVDFTASYVYSEPERSANMGEQKIVMGYKHNYDVSLVFKQVISTFGRLHYAVLASQMAEYAALEQYRQALEGQLATTAKKYLEVLLAQEGVLIAQEQLEAQKSSLKQAEDLYQGGTVAKFDVLSVRSAATSAELSLIEAKNLLRLAKASLCSDMGLPQGTEFNLANFSWEDIPDNVVKQYDLDNSIEEALQRRPEVLAAQWAEEAAKARLEVSRNNRNPTLALQSTVDNTRSSSMSPSTSWTTYLTLAVPVYDGGSEKAQTKQLEAVLEQLEAGLEAIKRGVRLDVEQCYYNLNSRWERIIQAKAGLDQAQEAYRVAQVRYGAGLSTPTELLNSQSALVAAKRSLATAKYSYLGANIDWSLATSGAYPFKVDGPLDKSDLKDELEAWYILPGEPRSEAEQLIKPVFDGQIPASRNQVTSSDEAALKKLNEQIKSQSLTEDEVEKKNESSSAEPEE